MSWAGVIAGGAAIAGGLLSSQGASRAADAAAQGSDRAIAEQRRQFDTILGLQQPGMVTGTGANNALARLYGLPYQEYQPPQSGQVTNALTGINGGSPGRTFNSSSFLGAGVGGAMFGLPGTLLGGSLFGGRQEPRYSWDANRGVVDVNGQAGKYAGGYINPQTGEAVVYTPGTQTPNAELSALATTYLRTGQGQLPDSLLRFGNAAGAVRQTGWQYNGQGGAGGAGGAGGVITPSGPDLSVFQNSPGYQFRRTEGLRGLERSAAARGGAFSGNAIRGAVDFNQNLASDDFYNFVNQMNTLAGRGQTAVNNTSGYASSLGSNVGNALMAGGNARASGIQGQYDAWGNAANQLGYGLGQWWNNRRQPAGVAPGGIPGGY